MRNLTKRQVYNAKNKEVRTEIYINGVFYTDKICKVNVENTNNLPLQ